MARRRLGSEGDFVSSGSLFACCEDSGGDVTVAGSAEVLEESCHSLVIRIVAGDNGSERQERLNEPQHIEVETFGAIEEKQINFGGQIGSQGLKGIANTELDPVGEPGGS